MPDRYVNGRLFTGKESENSSFISGSGSGREVAEKGGLNKEITLSFGEEGAEVEKLKINNREVDYDKVCPKAEIVDRGPDGVLRATGELGDPNGVVRMDYGDRIR